jgi:hypothetical protein
VAVYVVIKTADAKAARKTGAGQQPSRSFPNLISHLATLSRNDLAGLAIAVRLYGALAAASGPSVHDQLTAGLECYLAAAGDQQDRLSELLGTDPAARPVGWPLRGELISHLDRLRGELRANSTAVSPRPRRIQSWRRPLQAGRRQRRSPTRQRPPP